MGANTKSIFENNSFKTIAETETIANGVHKSRSINNGVCK